MKRNLVSSIRIASCAAAYIASCTAWLGLPAAALAQAAPAGQADRTNLLPNPSFEADTNRAPTGWHSQNWNGKPGFSYPQAGHTGQRSVMISSDEGADACWTCTVPVEPFAKYRLSGWIKTENLKVTTGRGAMLNIHNLQPVATSPLTGTTDWTQVEVTFDTKDQDALQINCLYGSWGLATGKAWYDDLKLELVSKSTAPEPRITIDAAKTGAPISKYVYGQFIEHLGRCIYGGIWAEMLEDRKFFYDVGAKESAWKPIGPANAVTMIREKPFVGEHTPQIALPGDGKPSGIAQSGLGLAAGKSYVGRIWLAGTPESGPVQVALVWGAGPNDRQTVKIERLSPEFAQTPLSFTAGAGTDDGRLEITSSGKGSFRVGTVSLMPADNVAGMRADTLKLLKELNSPVYRWPGGNFVSGYNWKDGIGDPDRRPPRKNPAWQGLEHNDFGIHEFMTFCREIKTEPYVTVNSGQGDVQMAVDEVQYANGAADTPMGQLRAKNGHPEPYGVKYWSIGNEMYGDWQLGHMPLEKYVDKHNQFAEAMRKVDPSIQLIAVGAAGPWSERMLTDCAGHMELMSEHFYCGSQPGLLGHMRQIPGEVHRIAEAHRGYRKTIPALTGRNIRVALDEWNYWYGPELYGEIGARYFLKDALGIAAGLNEFARQSDIYFMANYAQTVNVIGAIKTSKTAAEFDTTGLVLKLYREHFGVIPVATQTTPLLDAQAAWSEDHKTLTIAVANPSLSEVSIALNLSGAKLAGTGTRWQIAGNDPMAYNEPGQPPRVSIETAPVDHITDKLTVAPCSVTLFSLNVQ
jgi:alpha-L-arabinofuranosidase